MNVSKFKSSTTILYIFYNLYCLNKEMSIKELSEELRLTRKSVYNNLELIEVFISEFFLYNIEVINQRGKIKIVEKE